MAWKNTRPICIRRKGKKEVVYQSYLESTVTRQEEFSEVKSSLIPTVDKGVKNGATQYMKYWNR